MTCTANAHVGVRGRKYSAARSALMSTAWRTASLPPDVATACAGMLPVGLCWEPSGPPQELLALQGACLELEWRRWLHVP